MKQRTFRLRRAAVTLTLGVGVIGGVVAGASGIAAATSPTLPTSPTVGSLSAGSAPTVASTGSNQAAGNLTVTLNSGTTVASTDVIDLIVSDSGAPNTGNGTVCFTAAPSYTASGINVGAPTVGAGHESATACTVGASDLVQIPISTTGTLSSAATITLSSVAYSTSGATGTLAVYGYLDSSSTDVPVGTTPADVIGVLTPVSGVSNATLPAAPPGTPTFSGLTALTTPNVGKGANNQAAGNWTVTVSGATTTGWVSGDEIAITVNDNTAANCNGNDYVYFGSTPTATVTTSNFGSTTAPTVTTALGYTGSCASGEPNVALVEFTNTGTLPTSGTFTIVVSGVTYDVGSTANAGNVSVSAEYETGATPPVAIATVEAASTTGATTGPSNADIQALYVTANSPAVIVPTGAINSAISPVNIVEATADTLPAGYVCLTLPSGDTFNTSSVPTVKVASGNATVSSSAPTFQTSTGGTANDSVVFQVTGQSTTGNPSTITVSGLTVNNTAGSGAVTLDVNSASSTTTCPAAGATGTIGEATAFTVGTPSTQIYGADADGTAVAELEHEFVPGTECPGSNSTGTSSTGILRPVVLATDSNYPDALAGAYLARYLGTGELLTPTASLSSETATALRQEGITNVYVVGGPLAVSQAVVSQIEALDSYNCGGSAAQVNTLGQPVPISVTQIYGPTLYDTAQDIAEYAPSAFIGKLSFTGAYSGTNTSGGNGKYNDTSGNGSTSANTSVAVPTAILATGSGWQDAESASALSYADALPILLTSPSALSSQAQTAITTLGIDQVIVMGGPDAIANSVVTSLQGLGVSVLRIAGQDYTDTADQLASFEVNTTTGGLGLGWNPNGTLTVARGDFYSDGLAGAVDEANGGVAYAAIPGVGNTTNPTHPTPLLETFSPSTLGSYLPTFLATAGSATGIDGLAGTTAGDKITSLVVLGGPLAVTPSQISTMQGDL